MTCRGAAVTLSHEQVRRMDNIHQIISCMCLHSVVSCSICIIFNWYHNYLISCIDFDDLLAILSNFIPTLYCLSPFFMMSKRGRKLLSMKRGRLDKHEKSFEKWKKVQKGEKNVKYFYLKGRISKKKKFWKFENFAYFEKYFWRFFGSYFEGELGAYCFELTCLSYC